MSDELKAAEKRAYQRGYEAGQRRKNREVDAEKAWRAREAFTDRAFLALLPVAMQVDGWTMGGKPVTTSEDRVTLAVQWARRATKARKG